MNTLELSVLIAIGSLIAGFLGALTGLEGGVVITPLLTLAFGVDIRYAIGATLVTVIATSSGAEAAYVREGLSSIRIGMLLEVATSIGAVVGASIAVRLPTTVIATIFGFVLLVSAYLSVRPGPQEAINGPSVVVFALERDRLYLLVTLVVLTVLILSLTTGHT